LNILRNELEGIYESLKRDKKLMESNQKSEEWKHYKMVCHLIIKFEIEGKINS
jgi:hypothetical protein